MDNLGVGLEDAGVGEFYEEEEGMDFQPSQYTIFSEEYSQYRSSNDQVLIEDLDSENSRDMFSFEFSNVSNVLIEDLGPEDSPDRAECDYNDNDYN